MPQTDGVLYAALSPASAIAEAIQVYRNQSLTDADFEIGEGKIQSLARLKLSPAARLIDLTDARELARRSIRPADVVTHERSVSRRLALSLFEEGVEGFLWWSALEAAWTNVTLFQSRAARKLRLLKPIHPLTVQLPELKDAARFLKIRLLR